MIRLLGGTIHSKMAGQATLETRTKSLTSLSCGVLLLLSCGTGGLLKILLGLLLHVGRNRLLLRARSLETGALHLKVGMLHLKLRVLILELRTGDLRRRVTHV
jgi:hypothetical protein